MEWLVLGFAHISQSTKWGQELIVVLHSDFPHYFIKVDYSADGQTLAVLQASGALHRFKRQSWDSLDDSWEELPYMPKPSTEDVMRSGVCQVGDADWFSLHV